MIFFRSGFILFYLFICCEFALAKNISLSEFQHCEESLLKLGYRKLGKIKQQQRGAGGLERAKVFVAPGFYQSAVAILSRMSFGPKTSTYDWNIEHALVNHDLDEELDPEMLRKKLAALNSDILKHQTVEKRIVEIVKRIHPKDFFDITFLGELNDKSINSIVLRVYRNADLYQKIFPKFRGIRVFVDSVDPLFGHPDSEDNKFSSEQRRKCDRSLVITLKKFIAGDPSVPKILPVRIFEDGKSGSRVAFLKPQEVLGLSEEALVSGIALRRIP